MGSDLKILIVDDHKLFAAGLSRLLAGLALVVNVTEKYSGAQALSALDNGQQFDLILIELDLPSMSGLDLLLAIRSRHIQTHAVVVSSIRDRKSIQAALKYGAKGYIPKNSTVEILHEALKRILLGEVYLPEYLVSGIRSSPASSIAVGSDIRKLSGRQEQIVHLIQQGKTNKQIADILNIKQSTVKFHVSALFKVLNVRTRTECVHVARQHNLTT